MYQVTKTYDHNLGLSACFRQWRTKSHCRFLHGYAIAVKLTFQCNTLDENNWVISFGALKPIKAKLEELFDHKTLVAHDDPERAFLEEAHRRGVADVIIVDSTGCERFADMIEDDVQAFLKEYGDYERRGVKLISVEVREHGGNSALKVC
jgi:6-pyruvoyltetrahydropterin/6-carboxytetrahydropterin synthase